MINLPKSPKPPKEIPQELYDRFIMNNRVEVKNWYINQTRGSKKPRYYKTKQIDRLIKKAEKRKTYYYGQTDVALYKALDKYNIAGKSVVIMGSVRPWYESICLSYHARCTTIEYNKIICHDSRLKVMTVDEYDKNPIRFDMGISISSFEHDGLGRYGDPINPDGDLEAMKNMKHIIKKDGLLFLSVPVARDVLVWNACRVYGDIRFPLLIKDWELLEAYKTSLNRFQKYFNKLFGQLLYPQPVFVLRNI